MPLSWNEIKSRAIAFSKEWSAETSERAEAQSFWNAFFHIFGIERRRVVLDTRAGFPGSTLADLYDPLTMPPALLKVHQRLDAAVDAAYGRRSFKSDAERVAFLFELYARYTSLLPSDPGKRPARALRPARQPAS